MFPLPLSLPQLLGIAIAAVVVGGVLYWIFVAGPRDNKRRRDELLARREAQGAWDQGSRNR